jgi:hypothetical protein
MGCFVVTNTIRILSEVFDDRAIEGNYTSEIGNVFCLERLVLVAPDIPVETIMPRRANFLRASLHRCKEAYVFCNEGDLALRLASTVANYFSFPAKDRKGGYRLGNITAKWAKNQPYGIINLTGDPQNPVALPFDHLELRAFDGANPLASIRPRETISKETQITLEAKSYTPQSNIITDWFTYFDCTDYKDYKGTPNRANQCDAETLECIVSIARGKSILNLMDYLVLCFCSSINTHGGYFDGVLSQRLIYDLAFLGFQERLQLGFSDRGQSFPELLDTFNQQCRDKQIKVVLAPSRYQNSG